MAFRARKGSEHVPDEVRVDPVRHQRPTRVAHAVLRPHLRIPMAKAPTPAGVCPDRSLGLSRSTWPHSPDRDRSRLSATARTPDLVGSTLSISPSCNHNATFGSGRLAHHGVTITTRQTLTISRESTPAERSCHCLGRMTHDLPVHPVYRVVTHVDVRDVRNRPGNHDTEAHRSDGSFCRRTARDRIT